MEEDLPEPAALKRLRWLVTALLGVLIVGMIAVTLTLVIGVSGLGERTAPVPIAAERLTLPTDERVTALGRAQGEILIWTRDAAGTERLRAFADVDGTPRSVTAVVREFPALPDD